MGPKASSIPGVGGGVGGGVGAELLFLKMKWKD
jgi:hypothetical protein